MDGHAGIIASIGLGEAELAFAGDLDRLMAPVRRRAAQRALLLASHARAA